MRKIAISTLMAGAMALGGCTASPLGGLFGGVLGGSPYDQNRLSDFERAAANACGQEASRYGQVQITSVRQIERDIVEVRGRVENYNRFQNFRCAFRSDGRVVGFDI